MRAGIYQIDDPKAQRTVYKGYVLVYEGMTRTKHWCDGVHPTRKKAEDASKRLLKELRYANQKEKEDA